jgi:dolichyl-diphosphooligosaccharide--protein glycosyltransferase
MSLRTLRNRLKFPRIKGLFPPLERTSILFFGSLIFIIILTIAIRVLPAQWGFTLSEFDPYYQYDITRHIAENGLLSWKDLHIDDIWFPIGRDVGPASFPGLPMSGAIFYHIATSLGFYVSVLDVCIIFPVIFACLSVVSIFYLGKELGGLGVGLLSALFLTLSPAYIGRTSLGFYDDETIGIFGVIITSLFFIRSLQSNASQREHLGYAVAAGLGFGYVAASWGASRYLISLIALSAFLFLVLKRSNRRLLISYGTFLFVGLSIAALIPKLGVRYIQEFEVLIAIGVFLILVIQDFSQRVPSEHRLSVGILSIVGIGVLAVVLGYLGIISFPAQRFMSVLNPFTRFDIPLVQSVQEHRPATWASFYYQFGMLVFLAPLGIIFALRDLNHIKLYTVVYVVSGLYSAASLIRLTILAAPALCILGAFAISVLLQPFVNIIFRQVSRRQYRFNLRVGRSFSILLILISFVLILQPLLRGLDAGYAPTTVSASSLPVRAEITDWSEALTWMKTNLPPHTVVVSWWDYGYWITVMGEQITLADNGTTNSTQIAWIGQMFMSTEEDALAMINEFNAYSSRYGVNYPISYIVVFSTISQAPNGQFLYGDEVKWRWMAQIAGLDDTALEDTSITSLLANQWSQSTQDAALLQWYETFATIAIPHSDRILTKFMIFGAFSILEPEQFELSFSSSNKMVFVYRVLYP